MGERREVLVFAVADQRYALALADVREVVAAVALTRLPGAPPLVEGVFDLRGDLVPVIDLRSRLGLPARPMDPGDHLVVLESTRPRVALHVDTVEGLRDPGVDALEGMTEVLRGDEVLEGVTRLPDGLVLVLDAERFLTGAEADSLGAALSAGRAAGENG